MNEMVFWSGFAIAMVAMGAFIYWFGKKQVNETIESFKDLVDCIKK